MANWKKIGWITGVGTASLTGLFFLARGVFNKAYSLEELKKLSDRLQSIPTAKIHKLDFTGLTIRIDVKLKNPTTNGLKMRYPFISVAYGEKKIGSSQAVDKLISIPPNGEANIEAILLNFPVIGMLSLIGTLLKSLQSGHAVQLTISTSTTIDPLWQVDPVSKEWKSLKDYGIKKLRAIPYEDKQEVTLLKSKGGGK
jgi:hypothetical protein